MTITITITGDCAEEVQRGLATLLEGFEKTPATPVSAPAPVAEPTPAPAKAKAKKKAEPVEERQISTQPENRVAPEESPAVDEQDAQDEADEEDRIQDMDDPPISIEDLRAAMLEYKSKFGGEAVQADGPKIFVDALGKPPASEPYWKLTIIEKQGQAAIDKAYDAWALAASGDTRYRT